MSLLTGSPGETVREQRRIDVLPDTVNHSPYLEVHMIGDRLGLALGSRVSLLQILRGANNMDFSLNDLTDINGRFHVEHSHIIALVVGNLDVSKGMIVVVAVAVFGDLATDRRQDLCAWIAGQIDAVVHSRAARGAEMALAVGIRLSERKQYRDGHSIMSSQSMAG